MNVLRWTGSGCLEKRVYLALVREGDVVFDIGANLGHFTLLFSDLVGRRGEVHAFEPVPPTFVTRIVAEKLPDAVGVPLIKPVLELTVNPPGKPVALNEVGPLVPAI